MSKLKIGDICIDNVHYHRYCWVITKIENKGSDMPIIICTQLEKNDSTFELFSATMLIKIEFDDSENECR